MSNIYKYWISMSFMGVHYTTFKIEGKTAGIKKWIHGTLWAYPQKRQRSRMERIYPEK